MFGSLMKISTLYSFLYGKARRIGESLCWLKRTKKVYRIIAWLRYKKNKAFLKEHHCHTWRQYNRDNDTDIIRYATLVSQFYHGYPYHVKFEEVPYPILDWMKWVKDMWDWCDKNCSDKFRYDIHRVLRERGLIHNQYNDTMIWSEIDDYSMNDVGGHDILFFAFKNEKDLLWFKLRWC